MIKEIRPTVFVVDDDAAVRDSLRMLLKSVGLPVEVFESGQEFLDAERDDRPGCLVLDIRMPGMSGLELQVKLNERHSILPIIFITGHGDVPMAVEAMQAGAVDFIQKPFRDQDLLDRINQALEKDAGSRRMLAERNMIRKRLESLTPRETRSARPRRRRQGEQGHRGRPQPQPAHCGNPPRTRDGKNGSAFVGASRAHGAGGRAGRRISALLRRTKRAANHFRLGINPHLPAQPAPEHCAHATTLRSAVCRI